MCESVHLDVGHAMKPYHNEEYKRYKAEFYVFPGLLVAATMSRFPAVQGILLHGKNRFI